MLYATNRFPGDGMTTQYEISFVGGYLDRTHVKAYVEGADLVQTTVTLSPGNFLGQYTIGGLTPVPVGSTLVIYRDTPKAQIVDFVNGSRFTEANLDTATRQGSFIAAEGADAVSPAGLAGVIQQIADFSGAAGVARDQAVGAKNTVVAASGAASLSASNANDSALSAAADAASALSNKNLSDTAAFNASTSATQAQGFRNTASTHATNAGNSATAAAGSATTASNAQAAVATSASNAAASAASASASATQVSNNTADALASKNAAANSALSAATSATQSANSATASASSSTTATTAKDSAVSAATTAGTHASTATTQAGIATTKAGVATTKASEASASAVSAAASAASINPAGLVNTSTAQTIAGVKTFTSPPVVPSMSNPSYTPANALNYTAATAGFVVNAWPGVAGAGNHVVHIGWHTTDARLVGVVDSVAIGTIQTSGSMGSGSKIGAVLFAHYNVVGSTIGVGTAVNGADLRPASPVNHQGVPLTGVWTCLGYCVGSTDATSPGAKTMFIRTS